MHLKKEIRLISDVKNRRMAVAFRLRHIPSAVQYYLKLELDCYQLVVTFKGQMAAIIFFNNRFLGKDN